MAGAITLFGATRHRARGMAREAASGSRASLARRAAARLARRCASTSRSRATARGRSAARARVRAAARLRVRAVHARRGGARGAPAEARRYQRQQRLVVAPHGFAPSRETQRIVLRRASLEFAWGPRSGGDPDRVAAVELAVASDAGAAGSFWIEALSRRAARGSEHGAARAHCACVELRAGPCGRARARGRPEHVLAARRGRCRAVARARPRRAARMRRSARRLRGGVRRTRVPRARLRGRRALDAARRDEGRPRRAALAPHG